MQRLASVIGQYAPRPPRPLGALRLGRNPLLRRVAERDGLPVLPGHFPVVGHMPAMAVDFLGLLREGAALGDLFWWNAGFDRWEVVYVGRDAFQLFKHRHLDSSYMLEGNVHDLFGDGVIAHDGARHQHLRSAMNAPFLPKGLTEADVGRLVAEIVERRVRSWVGRRDVRILAETRELALDVMFRLVGVDEHELGAWRKNYEDLMLIAINLPVDWPGLPRWRGLRARAWLNDRLQKLIDRVRARGEERGLVAALLASRDEEGHALTDPELVDNLRLIFLAGHETSATTIAWMVAHLAERPDVWARLREEALAAPDLPRSPKELRSFPYAEAVFRETLRLHPPVNGDARRATSDFELAGHTVRRGTNVGIPIILLSRDPEQYPDPDAFKPERWLGRAERTPLELVQFGGGPHFCLGYHLAWMEIVQAAVALARALPPSGPRLQGAFPVARYMPLMHPAADTRVHFDRAAG